MKDKREKMFLGVQNSVAKLGKQHLPEPGNILQGSTSLYSCWAAVWTIKPNVLVYIPPPPCL